MGKLQCARAISTWRSERRGSPSTALATSEALKENLFAFFPHLQAWLPSCSAEAQEGRSLGPPTPATERPPSPLRSPLPPAAPPAPQRPARRAQPGPPHPRPQGQAPTPRVSEPHAGAPAAEGAPGPRLTCTLDPGAARRGAGRWAQASAARRLKLCCSRDGAVVTSSRSGRRGPGCDPAARAVARRALQPPARPPAPPALARPGCPGADTPARLAHGCQGPAASRPPSLHPCGSFPRRRTATEPVFSGWVWKISLRPDAFRVSSRAKSDLEGRVESREEEHQASHFKFIVPPNKFARRIKNCNKKPPFLVSDK
ncbi:uncharacterized protein LOC144616581 [Panthera onca]